MNNKQKLDRIDRKILSILQSNARISNQQLSEEIGLSPSSCLKRTRRLEDAGLLGPYLASINLDSLCRSVTVLATVVLKDHTKEAFIAFQKHANSIREVLECYMVSGSFDFFLRIVAADMNSYNHINDRLLDSDVGVLKVSSHVVLSQSKSFGGFPLERLL